MIATGDHLEAIAKRAGVSRMTLWRFTKGLQVSPQSIHRILSALGLDAASIIKVAA